MHFLDILKQLGPAILLLVPGAAPFIPLIMAGMTLAEQSKKPGAAKKAIALEVVKVGAAATNAIAKRQAVDVEAAVAVAASTIDAVIGAVNLVQQARALPVAAKRR